MHVFLLAILFLCNFPFSSSLFEYKKKKINRHSYKLNWNYDPLYFKSHPFSLFSAFWRLSVYLYHVFPTTRTNLRNLHISSILLAGDNDSYLELLNFALPILCQNFLSFSTNLRVGMVSLDPSNLFPPLQILSLVTIVRSLY